MSSSILKRRDPTPPPSRNGMATDAPRRPEGRPRSSGAPVCAGLPEPPRTPPHGTGPGPERWGHARRILFRFAFVYLALHCLLPFLLGVPGMIFGGWVSTFWQPYAEASDGLVRWVAEHVFQVETHPRFGARGDITTDYVQVFCHLVLAAAATAIWSLLDRKRPNHLRLFTWLRVVVCFYLAAEMVSYGVVKVIPSQFLRLSPEQLTTRVGDMDRMTLLWTFMAASPAYTIFTGAAELVGGLLLTCRRTRLLGALVCTGVLANVVMLNFGYDVCVKLHSSHLLGLCLFVAAPDLRRLVDFFLLGRAPQPALYPTLFATRRLRRGARAVMTALVLGFVALSLRDGYALSRAAGVLAPDAPLPGVWSVKEFVADGAVQPPLLTDQRYWRRAIFDPGIPGYYPAMLKVTRLDDTRQNYLLDLNTDRRTVTLSKFGDPAWQATLTYRQPAPQTLVLEGRLDGRRVLITLDGLDGARWPINRGFRWVSD